MSKLILFCSLLCFVSQAQAEQSKTYDYGTYSLKLLGKFKPSFYWGAIELDDGAPREIDLKAKDGKILATVSKDFFKAISMEGTGKLLDRRVLNFDTRLTNPDGSTEIRWRVCPPEAPYGYGKDNRLLYAFKSLAVDPKEIPLDATIYIPEAKGAVLPSGQVHDGMFKASDVGTLIQGARIDVFTAFGDQKKVFEKAGMAHLKPVTVYLVQKTLRDWEK